MTSSQAAVSVARINRFLCSEELNPENVQRPETPTPFAVKIEDGLFSWSSKEEPSLKKFVNTP